MKFKVGDKVVMDYGYSCNPVDLTEINPGTVELVPDWRPLFYRGHYSVRGADGMSHAVPEEGLELLHETT